MTGFECNFVLINIYTNNISTSISNYEILYFPKISVNAKLPAGLVSN